MFHQDEPQKRIIEEYMKTVSMPRDDYDRNVMTGKYILCDLLYIYLDKLHSEYDDIHETIIIYSQIKDFEKFFNTFINLELKKKHKRDTQYLSNLKRLQMLMNNPLFTFEQFPPLKMKEMLGFLQHSLPIVFISGDNTPAEFISVNKSKTLYIVYSAFVWKRGVSNALGVNVDDNAYGGIAEINRSKFMDNIKNNFSINGMVQVENLMKKSLIPSVKCANTDFRNIMVRVLDGTSHFLYKPSFQKFGPKQMLLNLKLHDNSFDTNTIQGEFTPVAGAGMSDAKVYKTAWDNVGKTNLFVKFIRDDSMQTDDCSHLSFQTNMNEDGIIELPISYNALINSRVINDFMDDDDLMNRMLVKTHATVLNISKCGASNVRSKMFENIADSSRGIFIIQDEIPNSYVLRYFFSCTNLHSSDFAKMLSQLMYGLNYMQSTVKFVHNDLWGGNIMVQRLDVPVRLKFSLYGSSFDFKTSYIIKFIDTDTASYKVGGKHVGPYKIEVSDNNNTYDNTYDILFFLQDTIDAYTNPIDKSNKPDKYCISKTGNKQGSYNLLDSATQILDTLTGIPNSIKSNKVFGKSTNPNKIGMSIPLRGKVVGHFDRVAKLLKTMINNQNYIQKHISYDPSPGEADDPEPEKKKMKIVKPDININEVEERSLALIANAWEVAEPHICEISLEAEKKKNKTTAKKSIQVAEDYAQMCIDDLESHCVILRNHSRHGICDAMEEAIMAIKICQKDARDIGVKILTKLASKK